MEGMFPCLPILTWRFPQHPSQLTPLWVTTEEVDKAIRSFPCASATGPDGLRPQHLRDMTGAAASEGGRLLLQALASSTNLVLEGRWSKRHGSSSLEPP